MRNPLPQTEHRKGIAVPDSDILVIGVGNETRGDDAVGRIVAKRLKEKLGRYATVVEELGDGTRLLDLWRGSELTVIIDAVLSGAEPGHIHRFDARESPLPAGLFHYSTHSFGVPEAIELARAMNQLPKRIIVYGIEGECFDERANLSPTVELAAQELAELLTAEILQHQPLTISPTQTAAAPIYSNFHLT
jgi:hydrogenase maturation protease